MEKLREKLQKISKRLAAVTFVSTLLVAVFYALFVAVGIVLVGKFFPLGTILYVFLGACAAAPLVWAAVHAGIKRASLFAGAVAVDRELGLQERLSSAILLEKDDAPAARACCRDAASRAETIDVKKTFPFSVPRIFKWAVIPAVVAVLLYVMPWTFDITGAFASAKERTADKKDVIENAKDLEKGIEKLEKRLEKLEPSEDVKNAIKEMKDLCDWMKRNPEDRKKVLRKIGKLENSLKRALEPGKNKEGTIADDAGDKEASASMKALSEAIKKKDPELAKKAWEKVAEEWKDATDEQKKEMARELKRLSRSMSGGSQMDREMAEALRKLADALKGLAEATEGSQQKQDLQREVSEMSEAARKALERLMRDKEALERLLQAIKDARQGLG